MTRDLDTFDGVVSYIESSVIPSLQASFRADGYIRPHAVVFAQTAKGNPLQALLVSVPDTMFGQASLFDISRLATETATQADAVGAMLIHQGEFRRAPGRSGVARAVIIQVEHKRFADVVWSADLPRSRSTLLSPTLSFAGPVALLSCDYRVGEMRYLAERYMS